jgi:hypothetical protein
LFPPSKGGQQGVDSSIPPYLTLYDLAVEESSIRLPPGAVTKRIYVPVISADSLDGGIGATSGIDAGGSAVFPPGAVMKRICGPGISADGLAGGTGATLGIDAGGSIYATVLPHMMQVSAPWTRRPLHLSQRFIIATPSTFLIPSILFYVIIYPISHFVNHFGLAKKKVARGQIRR